VFSRSELVRSCTLRKSGDQMPVFSFSSSKQECFAALHMVGDISQWILLGQCPALPPQRAMDDSAGRCRVCSRSATGPHQPLIERRLLDGLFRSRRPPLPRGAGGPASNPTTVHSIASARLTAGPRSHRGSCRSILQLEFPWKFRGE
jgi:hypothetical protein